MQTIQAPTADNALLLGQALHTGIEHGVERALQEYQASFPILDDLQVNEMIKLEYLIPKVKALLPVGNFEATVTNTNLDGITYIGFIDYVVKIGLLNCDLYDFKYTNNIKN